VARPRLRTWLSFHPNAQNPMHRCLVTRFRVSFHAFVRGWDRLLNELHGQHSLTRFDELVAFTRQTSTRRAIAILLPTPVTPVVVMVLLDALPLRPPSDGVFNQSANFGLGHVLHYHYPMSVRVGVTAFGQVRSACAFDCHRWNGPSGNHYCVEPLYRLPHAVRASAHLAARIDSDFRPAVANLQKISS
jgi:hypothetical protein